MLYDIIEKDELLNYYFQKGYDEKKSVVYGGDDKKKFLICMTFHEKPNELNSGSYGMASLMIDHNKMTFRFVEDEYPSVGGFKIIELKEEEATKENFYKILDEAYEAYVEQLKAYIARPNKSHSKAKVKSNRNDALSIKDLKRTLASLIEGKTTPIELVEAFIAFNKLKVRISDDCDDVLLETTDWEQLDNKSVFSLYLTRQVQGTTEEELEGGYYQVGLHLYFKNDEELKDYAHQEEWIDYGHPQEEGIRNFTAPIINKGTFIGVEVEGEYTD